MSDLYELDHMINEGFTVEVSASGTVAVEVERRTPADEFKFEKVIYVRVENLNLADAISSAHDFIFYGIDGVSSDEVRLLEKEVAALKDRIKELENGK